MYRVCKVFVCVFVKEFCVEFEVVLVICDVEVVGLVYDVDGL